MGGLTKKSEGTNHPSTPPSWAIGFSQCIDPNAPPIAHSLLRYELSMRYRAGYLFLILTFLCGCGTKTDSIAQPTTTKRESVRLARDKTANVTFRLKGDTLRVVIEPRPGPSIHEFDGQRLRMFCGRPHEYQPFGASATATVHVPRSTRDVMVRLSRDLKRDVGFCGVEGDDWGEAFGYFLPLRELLRRTGESQRR